MPPKLDIEQVKAILAASDLIASWQVLTEDETAHRALYRIRCRVLRAAYQLEIRFIQTENETIYSYQLFMASTPLLTSLAVQFPHGLRRAVPKNPPRRKSEGPEAVIRCPRSP